MDFGGKKEIKIGSQGEVNDWASWGTAVLRPTHSGEKLRLAI